MILRSPSATAGWPHAEYYDVEPSRDDQGFLCCTLRRKRRPGPPIRLQVRAGWFKAGSLTVLTRSFAAAAGSTDEGKTQQGGHDADDGPHGLTGHERAADQPDTLPDPDDADRHEDKTDYPPDHGHPKTCVEDRWMATSARVAVLGTSSGCLLTARDVSNATGRIVSSRRRPALRVAATENAVAAMPWPGAW